MRSSSSLKRDFLKKWVTSLQICSFSIRGTSVLERKKAIKLSADLAMASARKGTTCWSRALIANASKDDNNKVLIEHILGSHEYERSKQASIGSLMCNKRIRCKKILKKSFRMRRVPKKSCEPRMVIASSLAKRFIKKRTQFLRSLVPGGEFMDDISLMEETLDYIVSLRAQVDVMKTLVCATELVNCN
ncbi:hypothetical protein CFOL_v3_29632 [Cephalotus follicularis]|uniref:IBH1-like N-terminal domain-containing protein n=1 Tax=Cephalotus follicularis TaxID=3775 RepID=A0A1Q3D136_CEPFO|nr:hypothetical protein CFOL_v3_29632 [Cephalotus follicularis]